MAAREHLLEGKPITRLEAIVLYGVLIFTKLISDMRKQGWTVNSQKISYVAAARRVNSTPFCSHPTTCQSKKSVLTEYWVSK